MAADMFALARYMVWVILAGAAGAITAKDGKWLNTEKHHLSSVTTQISSRMTEI